MLKRVKIERVLGAATGERQPVENKVIPFGTEIVASAELQAERTAKCGGCEKNVAGQCRECCGGVPIAVKVRLIYSRCPLLPPRW